MRLGSFLPPTPPDRKRYYGHWSDDHPGKWIAEEPILSRKARLVGWLSALLLPLWFLAVIWLGSVMNAVGVPWFIQLIIGVPLVLLGIPGAFLLGLTVMFWVNDRT